MDKFPVELKQVYFTRSIVVALPEYAPTNPVTINFPPQNTINVQYIEGSDNDYVFVMQTLLNTDKNPLDPYMVDMECVAQLHINSELSKDEAMKAATITGHSVVYGAIREAVLWITGRHPFGPVSLGLSVLTPKAPETSEPPIKA
jgi:hypothetical protein